jgi:DNA-binding ferritin-like protein
MAFIPEEKIDRVLATVDDLSETAGAQTQAILILSERLAVQTELLVKIHEAVTKPADGGIADLLEALIEADKHHAFMLKAVLTAVQ